MKEQHVFICDYCKTVYKNKEAAIACEKGHHVPRVIYKSQYVSLGVNNEGSPTYIILEMDNGSYQKYKRVGPASRDELE